MTAAAVWTVALLLLAGDSSAAEPAPGRAPAAKTGKERNGRMKEKIARAHFARAEKAFNLGLFHDALTGYHAAYEALPLPAFLFNIGQCHRNLGNGEQAVFFYQRYLSLAPDAPNRPMVEDLISEQRRRVEAAASAAAATAPPGGRAEPPAAAAVDLAASPEPVPPGPALGLEQAPPSPPKPVYKRWWFWSAVGGAVLAGGATALLLSRTSPPEGALGSIDAR